MNLCAIILTSRQLINTRKEALMGSQTPIFHGCFGTCIATVLLIIIRPATNTSLFIYPNVSKIVFCTMRSILLYFTQMFLETFFGRRQFSIFCKIILQIHLSFHRVALIIAWISIKIVLLGCILLNILIEYNVYKVRLYIIVFNFVCCVHSWDYMYECSHETQIKRIWHFLSHE